MTSIPGAVSVHASLRRFRAGLGPGAFIVFASLSLLGSGAMSAQSLSATKIYPKFAIGVTGINATIENLAVVVQDLSPGSPAAGKFVTGDTLTSVEGNSLEVADPRVVLGEALTAAEGSDGQLVFGVQGKANVTVTIPVIGSYVPAWPAGGCPKSAAIIADLAAFVAGRQQGDGKYNFTGSAIRDGLDGCLAGLFLLSTGNAAYLPNVKLHARNLAAAAAGNPTTSNWHLGYQGILLAEYYLKTGDTQVLAGLQSLCDRAVSQQWAGGWGHHNGGTPGYVQSGLISSAGVPCLTTLILARECGVTVDDTAYKLALELMYRMAGHGNVPYGDHRPELWWSNTNGRNAMLACAFSLLDDPATAGQPHYKSAAEHLALLVADSYHQPEFGHTGGGFNVIWRGMGSVHVPAAKDANRQRQMNKLAWYYDLCRQYGGGFAILPTPPDNTRYSSPGLNWGCGAIGLTYTAPLGTLRITGAPKTAHSVADTPPPFTWGTPADLAFLSLEHASGFGVEDDDPEEIYDALIGSSKTSSTSYCGKYLRHYSPMVRSWAARRLKEINSSTARTVLAGAVTHADPRVRRAVYDALSGYDNWSRPFSANISSSNVSSTFMSAIEGTLHDADAAWWEIDGALFALGNALSSDIRANMASIDQFARHEEWFLREAAFWAVVGLGSDITGPEFKRLTDAYRRSVSVYERNSFDPGLRSVLLSNPDAFDCGQRAESVRTLGDGFLNVAIRPGYEQFKGDQEAAHRTMMLLDDFDGEVYKFMVPEIVRYLQSWRPGNQHSDWLITGNSWQVGFLAVLRDDLGAYGKPVVDEFKRILTEYDRYSGGTTEQKQAIQDAVNLWEATHDPLVYAPPVSSAALKVYYDFEGDFNDAPGAGSFADHLANNGVGFSNDVPGAGGTQSASFNGNAALRTNSFTADLGPDSEAFTIMFWVKAADAAQENSNTRLMTTRVRPAGGSAAQPAWQVEGFGNNGSNGDLMDVRFSEGACGTANWTSPDATGALANSGETAGWHHVAYVVANSAHPDYTGDAYSRTFVNGVEVGLASEAPWTDHPLGNTEGMLIIGGDATDGGPRGFTGLLDDVALFSGAVSHIDIAAIAAGTRSPDDPLQGPPPPSALAPVLGAPSASELFPDTATVHCDLQQASADVAVVWAYDDQGESDLATWAGAPGGGRIDLGSFAAGLPLVREITGLAVGTQYAFRFFADNPNGTDWSAPAGFTTPGSGNQVPTADDATFDVDENSPAGTVVGQVVAGDPDAGQSLGYAITDGDPGGLFAIGPASGQITVAGALDYEADARHVLTVTVTDDGSPVRSDTATVTVDVNDVFEVVQPPLMVTGAGSDITASGAALAYAISDTGGENPAVTVRYGLTDEGTDAGAWDTSVVLGVKGTGPHTATVSGLQPGTLYYYTFSGANSGGTGWGSIGSFRTELTGSAGVRLTAWYDFEGTGADRYDDPAGDFADDLVGQYNPAFSADAPSATSSTQSASFNGNSVLFTNAHTTDLGPDPDAYTIMFWIKARDIDQENTNTRLMSTGFLPNGSGVPGLYWQVEGFGNNGSSGDAMDVRLQNNGLGQNWFNPDATNALARADQGETVAAWHHVAYVLSNTGADTDGGAYGRTFVDGAQVGGTLYPDSVFDSVTIGNTAGQLIIGGHAENAGNRAFTGLLDDVALFAGVVDETDIAAIAAGTISPANFLSSPPVANDASFAVAENSPVGTAVGQVVASDPDAGQTLGYAITAGDPGGLFTIDAGGEITVLGALDYEAASQHVLTVTVSDDGTPALSNAAQITVDVLNVIETNGEAVAEVLTGPGGPFEGQGDPNVTGFAANPDRDQWLNAFEVLFGFDPAAADNATPMTASFVDDGGTTYVEVEIAVDAAMDDLMTWHLEFSSDLETWSDSSNPRVLVGESGGVRTVAIRDDQAYGTTPGRFYRLKILADE